VGSALGVSVIGSLLTVQTIRSATAALRHSALSAAVKVQAVAGVHASGSGYTPPKSLNPRDGTIVRGAIEHGVISGTRLALIFAAGVIALGTLVALLIPSDRVRPRPAAGDHEPPASASNEPVPVLIGGEP